MSPDEECLICGTKRDEHGDKLHQFSTDGSLVPITPGVKPREEAPKPKSEVTTSGPDVSKAFAALVEILAEKELINARDIIRIFSSGS